MKPQLIIILSILSLFISCNHDEDGNEIISSIQGKAQKGPFVNGSAVTVYELDEDLNPTGRSFSSKITDNQGAYKIDSVLLVSPYVQTEVEGLYYSELDGNVSFREITISSLVKLAEGKTSNVNLITQIENTRVKNLVRNGLSFEEAKKQSLKELIEIFSYPYAVNGTSESFDLFAETNDGMFLFCLSAVLLATNDDYDAAKHASWLNFMMDLEADFGDNGKIDSHDLENRLKLGVFYTLQNADQIREGFKRTIEITGASIEVPYFEPVVEKLFTEHENNEEVNFESASDFFPQTTKPNIANLLDGTLISTQDLVLALDVPGNLEDYNFSLEIKVFSDMVSIPSPAWEHYDAGGNYTYGTINLPTNNLLGRIEIPFEFDGVGNFSLIYSYQRDVEEQINKGEAQNYRKEFFLNANPSLPSEIDTVVISSMTNIYLQNDKYDRPTYVIVQNTDVLDHLRVFSVRNLYGIEFPDLTKINQEFSVSWNPNLRSFTAPLLESIEASFDFQGNPLVTIFELPELINITGDAQIQRNNNIEIFNMGGLSFGDDFSEIIEGKRLIQWIFNGQILEDNNGY